MTSAPYGYNTATAASPIRRAPSTAPRVSGHSRTVGVSTDGHFALTWNTPATFTSGNVLTAAQLNALSKADRLRHMHDQFNEEFTRFWIQEGLELPTDDD